MPRENRKRTASRSRARKVHGPQEGRAPWLPLLAIVGGLVLTAALGRLVGLADSWLRWPGADAVTSAAAPAPVATHTP